MRQPVQLLALVLALALGGAGCGQGRTPAQAFDRWAAAAEAGDEETLYDAMTAESASVLRGLLAVSKKPGALRLGGFPQQVRAGEFGLAGDGQLALVTVETSGERAERGQVVMRLEDGEWRLDLIATEFLWNREWELSGGPPRSGWLQIDPMENPPITPPP